MDDLVDRKLLAEMRGWVPLSLRSDGIGSDVLGQRSAVTHPSPRLTSRAPSPPPPSRRPGPRAVPLGDASTSENGAKARGGADDVLSSMARRLVRQSSRRGIVVPPAFPPARRPSLAPPSPADSSTFSPFPGLPHHPRAPSSASSWA